MWGKNTNHLCHGNNFCPWDKKHCLDMFPGTEKRQEALRKPIDNQMGETKPLTLQTLSLPLACLVPQPNLKRPVKARMWISESQVQHYKAEYRRVAWELREKPFQVAQAIT